MLAHGLLPPLGCLVIPEPNDQRAEVQQAVLRRHVPLGDRPIIVNRAIDEHGHGASGEAVDEIRPGECLRDQALTFVRKTIPAIPEEHHPLTFEAGRAGRKQRRRVLVGRPMATGRPGARACQPQQQRHDGMAIDGGVEDLVGVGEQAVVAAALTPLGRAVRLAEVGPGRRIVVDDSQRRPGHVRERAGLAVQLAAAPQRHPRRSR